MSGILHNRVGIKLQENQIHTLNFLDSELKSLSKHCFKINRESRIVLGIIAKNGPVSEYKIYRLGKRKRIKHFKRDVIRYRLLKSDLSQKNDFLTMKKGKKIGNINKVEKLYSLTFKGFLASLPECSIKDNFWIKNYMNMISKLTNETISKEFLKHIYYHVILFLILHSQKSGMLTNYEHPETDSSDEYYMEGPIGILFAQDIIKSIPLEFQEIFVNSIFQFFVSSEIVGNHVKSSKFIDSNLNKIKQAKKFENFLNCFFRNWMRTMFMINKSPEQILNSYEINEENIDMDGSIIVHETFGSNMWATFSNLAENELKELDPTIKYDRYASLFIQ